MKALLLKDFFVLCKQLKLMLLPVLLFAFLPGVSALAFCTVYVIMLPITTISYDERSKWNQLAAMMPYTARQLVLSKYLLGYIGAGLVAVLALFSQVCFDRGTSQDMLLTVLLMPCAGIILLSFLLPVMFRWGTEKGRLAYFLTAALLAGAAGGLKPEALPVVDPTAIIGVLLTAAVVCNLLSIGLSVQFYEKLKA